MSAGASVHLYICSHFQTLISLRPEIVNVITIDEHRSKSLETDCLIAIWRQMTIDTTLFLSMFDPRSSIINMFSIAAYPVGFLHYYLLNALQNGTL